jgi:hypothetical protein
MSNYFFNYTDIDLYFFNSNTSWIVTLDKGISDSDIYYNDSAVNYSLETRGNDLFFIIDPYAYYDGEHLNEEVVIQAYRNDSEDFAEQRFNLQIARDASKPEQTEEVVRVIGTIQNKKIGFNTTAYVTLSRVFENANRYYVEWFDREDGTTRYLSETYTESMPYQNNRFSLWFGTDELGRETLYIRSKQINYTTGFNVLGVDYRDGFGIVSEALQDFELSINGLIKEPTEDNIIDYVLPDSQDLDRKEQWIYAMLFIIGLSTAMYVMTQSIALTIIGGIMAFGFSVALGFLPIGIVVFSVLLLLGFIVLSIRR